MPRSLAPDLFAYDGGNHCYVQRQPATPEEFFRMLRATWSSEVECIRYRGNDPDVLRRMSEYGLSSYSDTAISGHVDEFFRTHVVFALVQATISGMGADQLAKTFMDYQRRSMPGDPATENERFRFKTPVMTPQLAQISMSWSEEIFHPIEFIRPAAADQPWLIRHSPQPKIGSQSVSMELDDWLRSDSRISGIRWFTEAEWLSKKTGREFPI
jgi:hypothetical protein